MLSYYLNSFKLDYQKSATRKEFITVTTLDALVFAKIFIGTFLLNHGTKISFLSFIAPLIRFFSNYKFLVYLLIALWTIIRIPFLVALTVRRFNAVGANPNWLYVPVYRVYLCLQKDKSQKDNPQKNNPQKNKPQKNKK